MRENPSTGIVTFRDIESAAKRLARRSIATPLLESPALDELTGGRILIKAECLQRTGSFKFRGAFNRLSRLNAAARRNGVVTYSSGNHAQGVAEAASLLGIRATIVMPEDAPEVKIRRTRARGGEIVFYDRRTGDRAAIARDIAGATGRVLVPPFDDPRVIAGQGTVGMEIIHQMQALGRAPDTILVPCGGGGLVAGVATAVKAFLPGTAIYAVEPEGFDSTRRSLKAGERIVPEPGSTTICDALQSSAGELTFAINRHLLSGGFAVSDDQVRHAMALAFEELKLVVEPGGAAALAALLGGMLDTDSRVVVVIASGGNADRAGYARALG